MASRVRMFVTPKPRHRRDRKAHTATYLPGEAGSQPRHCAGDTCLHDHPDDASLGRAPWANFHEVSA